MAKPNDWMEIVDAAQLAGVVTSTMYRWIAAGRLPLYRRGPRSLVRRRDVERLLRPVRASRASSSTRPTAA